MPENKPGPVNKLVVCSVCGLDWKQHERPDLDECVRLLKLELQQARRQTNYATVTTGGWTGPFLVQ